MNRTTGRRAGCLALPILCLLSVLSGTAAGETQAIYGALTPAPETLRACTLPEMTPGKVLLETDCRYTEPVVISADNILLDCRGGTITGMHRRGITIRPGLKNITIRDCRLDDTGGILIEGQTPSDDAAARDEARANSSQGVVLDHLTITKSYMTGVFVDHYVVGATIRNSIVADGHHVGIYLEHGSQRNVVSGNLIRNNGLFTNKGIRRIGPTRREGLSVDGSAYNLIENNIFDSNAFGGIFHYKNCWEFHTTNPESRPRLQGSDGNVIRGNVFRNMDIGIWVASRQARDLVMWDCGDKSPYGSPVSLAPMMGDRPWGQSDTFLGITSTRNSSPVLSTRTRLLPDGRFRWSCTFTRISPKTTRIRTTASRTLSRASGSRTTATRSGTICLWETSNTFISAVRSGQKC